MADYVWHKLHPQRNISAHRVMWRAEARCTFFYKNLQTPLSPVSAELKPTVLLAPTKQCHTGVTVRKKWQKIKSWALEKIFPAFRWQLEEDKRRWKCWTFGFKEIIGAIAQTGVQSDAPAERCRFRHSAYWSCWFRQRISAKHSSNLHVPAGNLLQENNKACFLYSFTLL